MSLSQVCGTLMLVAFLGVLLYNMVKDLGWKTSLKVLGGSAFIMLWVGGAFYFLMSGAR